MQFIWYSKCSSCRKAKKYLDSQGISYELRDIKENTPSETELAEWHRKSGLPLKRFFNTSGQIYREQKLAEKLPLLTEEEQLRILASSGDGMLIKRPLLITETAAAAGFNETEWKGILRLSGQQPFFPSDTES